MNTTIGPGLEAWAVTDFTGRIEAASPGVRSLLGVTSLGRGDDLLMFFPLRRKALLFDMEVALTGWPTQRTVVIRPMGSRAITVRYRVSRRLQDKGVGLFWHLHIECEDENTRRAA